MLCMAALRQPSGQQLKAKLWKWTHVTQQQAQLAVACFTNTCQPEKACELSAARASGSITGRSMSLVH